MTREETVKIIRVMSAAFPNYKPNNMTETVDIWHMMLEEHSYNEIAYALKAYITSDSSGFAPSIGQLMDKLHSLTAPEQLNDMEAWAMVQKAIKRSTYYAVEEYAKLPQAVQKAVGTHDQLKEWAVTEDLNMEVAKASFLRCYRTEVSRAAELAKMPDSIKNLIAQANVGSDRLKLEQYRKDTQERAMNNVMALEMHTEGVPCPAHLKEKLEEVWSRK